MYRNSNWVKKKPKTTVLNRPFFTMIIVLPFLYYAEGFKLFKSLYDIHYMQD